jgi:hypothetical protein
VTRRAALGVHAKDPGPRPYLRRRPCALDPVKAAAAATRLAALAHAVAFTAKLGSVTVLLLRHPCPLSKLCVEVSIAACPFPLLFPLSRVRDSSPELPCRALPLSALSGPWLADPSPWPLSPSRSVPPRPNPSQNRGRNRVYTILRRARRRPATPAPSSSRPSPAQPCDQDRTAQIQSRSGQTTPYWSTLDPFAS